MRPAPFGMKKHLIEKDKGLTDTKSWQMVTSRAFSEGYSQKDSVYNHIKLDNKKTQKIRVTRKAKG